ncbi:MAG: hypothetical protein QNL01_16300 [Akkermansiaceae bacterium]|jgi:hypothetical protein|tara:strand:- start:17992 stop:18726 length:735 start_codon:yes stop_codon:yes gene_type:complete
MKLTKPLIATFTALSFVIVGCEDKKAAVPHDHDGDGKPDHGPGAHPAPATAPVPHDHNGDGIPDHGPGAHPAPTSTPVPHDHDGDGKPDHGPGAHDHDAVEHKGHDAHGEDHAGHDHAKKVAGPNGGKVIITVEPHAELFVTADRKLRITFLGEDNKGIAVAAQSVSVVCGDRSKPTMLTLVKEADGNSLLSTAALPAGNNFPTIVTLKTTPEAAPVRDRFILNLNDCPTCKYKEYACTCSHSH